MHFPAHLLAFLSCVRVSLMMMLLEALGSHLDLRRYSVATTPASSVGWLNRNFTELEVRRAFTVFQLMNILEESHHSFPIVEYVTQALKQLGSLSLGEAFSGAYVEVFRQRIPNHTHARMRRRR